MLLTIREKDGQVGSVRCYTATDQRWDQRRGEDCGLPPSVHLSAWESFLLHVRRRHRRFTRTFSYRHCRAYTILVIIGPMAYATQLLLLLLLPLLLLMSLIISYISAAFSDTLILFWSVRSWTNATWLSWWLHWLSFGLVIERSLVRLPAGALSNQLGQLSLPSLGDG